MKIVASVAISVASAAALLIPIPGLNFAVSAAIAAGGAYFLSALQPKAKPLAPPVLRAIELRDLQQVVRSSVEPHRVIYGTRRLSGPLTYVANSGADKEFIHLIVPVAGHRVKSIADIQFDDVPANDARFAGYVRVNVHLGASDQAADPDLIQEVAEWTSAHRGRGIAYIYVRLKQSRDVWPTGLPQSISALVEGRDEIVDIRTGVPGWSDNFALCVLDYLRADFGLGISDDEFDAANFIAAANASDEAVAIEGGSQKRYTCDGALDLNAAPMAIMEALLSGGVGTLVWSSGQYRLFPAVAATPVFDLGVKHLRAPLEIKPRETRASLFNAVRGTYVSPQNKWQPTDFPPVVNALYEQQDGGQRIYRDIQFPVTTDPVRTQRMAKIHLELARQAQRVRFPGKPMLLPVALWDVTRLDLAQAGYLKKPFRVHRFGLAENLAVDLDLKEEAPGAYDWDMGEATAVDPAPNTSLPNPWVVGAPQNLVLESGDAHLLLAGDGTVISRILAAWDRPADAYVAGYAVEYGRQGEAALTAIDLGPAQTRFYIAPVRDGDPYAVHVYARNTFGAASPRASVFGHTVVGKISPPPRPDTFTVSQGADGTRVFRWTQATVPADVRVGGGFLIRWSFDLEAEFDAMTPLYSGVIQASPFESNELGAGDYRFAIKTVDSSGNFSAEALYINATLGNPRLRSTLASRNEVQLGWPGVKEDCFVDADGSLQAGGGTWNDLGSLTWADIAGKTFADLLPRSSPIRYTTPVIDLGANAQANPVLSVIADGAPVLEMRTGTDADGAPVGSFVAPAAATFRYIETRATVTGDAPALRKFDTLIDGESAIERWEDADTASYSEPGFFERVAAGHFKVRTRGGMSAISTATILAIQNVGGVASWELISKSATIGGEGPAAEFKIRNAAGTLIDAVVDVEIKGPKAV